MIDELNTAGSETQLLALIRHVDRTRIRPYLCLLRGDNPGSRSLEPEDCPVLRLGVRSLCRFNTLAKGRRLAQFLRRERIDVLQVYFPDSTYLGVLVGRLAGVPHIVRTCENLGYSLTPLHRRLGRLYSHLADVTIANCEACREAIVAQEGSSRESVVVLESGVDLDRFSVLPALTAHSGKLRVGVVANLRPVKNLDVFVRAAAAVAQTRPEVTFAVAGEGESRSALERLATELRLGARLSLPGIVRDVPAFLGGVDVAVLSSSSEGMSNAVLEYMAAGRGIVATRVGANDRLLDDGIHGLLVPPGEVAALAAGMGRLLDDAELRVRLGAAARQRVEQEWGRQAMVRRFERFYENLVGQAGKPDRHQPECR
jgi:glycosyltransferase involved in cell wall biosynthesis